MKVLIITASLNERSGWGRYSRAIIDNLIATDIKVVVCSEGAADVPYPVRGIARLTSPFSFLKNIVAVRRAARGVAVVHALDGWPYGVYGYAAVLGTKIPLFINGVATYSVAPLYGGFLTRWSLRKAYARAQKIFCVSEYTRAQLADAGIDKTKLVTVLQGTTPIPDISADERAAFRVKYGVEDRRPLILTVGAVKERKGQIDTLRAVELLKSEYPDILYAVIGSTAAGYAGRLVQYASNHRLDRNLLVVTDADDKALSYFYSECDVFALNSTTDMEHHHFEGFGLVIVEAYQFGKPAVGSSDCGIEDAIHDGVTGFLTKQRDAKDIAEHIAKILKEPTSFSENAKKRYAFFDWRKTVAEYVKWYPAQNN